MLKCIDLVNLVTYVFQPYLPTIVMQEAVDRKISQQSYVKRVFLMFPTPKSEKGSSWRAYFGVVRQPIFTFLIEVVPIHRPIFFTNQFAIVNTAIFVGRVFSALNK